MSSIFDDTTFILDVMIAQKCVTALTFEHFKTESNIYSNYTEYFLVILRQLSLVKSTIDVYYESTVTLSCHTLNADLFSK